MIRVYIYTFLAALCIGGILFMSSLLSAQVAKGAAFPTKCTTVHVRKHHRHFGRSFKVCHVVVAH